MKRSEARNLIKDVLNKNTKGIDGHPSSDTAQEILNILEEKGMLPPIVYPYSCGCSMRGFCPTCTPTEYKMYNTWEKENDET